MNGQTLWTIFIGGQVPDNELVALGEDAGMLERQARPLAQQALLKICMKAARDNNDKVLFTPSQLFDALKFAMPDSRLVRRGLLHAVASEYEQRKVYTAVLPDVRGFFDSVAIILGQILKPMPVPTPSAAMAGSLSK